MNTVDSCGNVVSVVVNITDEVQYFKKREIVGYFTPIEDDVLKSGLVGKSTDEVFGHFSREPKDPTHGPLSEALSEEDRKPLIGTVSIKAPYN